MNRFIGIGNLCHAIELKYTSNNKVVLRNTIAIKYDYKNSYGEYDSEFVNIVAWGKTAEYLSNYAEKGTKIAIEGELHTRTYDKTDGTKGYITEIVCNNVEILGKKQIKKENITENKENDIENEQDLYSFFGETVVSQKEKETNEADIELNDLQLPFE